MGTVALPGVRDDIDARLRCGITGAGTITERGA
jgi:hypothetical protein